MGKTPDRFNDAVDRVDSDFARDDSDCSGNNFDKADDHCCHIDCIDDLANDFAALADSSKSELVDG